MPFGSKATLSLIDESTLSFNSLDQARAVCPLRKPTNAGSEEGSSVPRQTIVLKLSYLAGLKLAITLCFK